METAPLTLAHTHARNAALEARRHNPVAASEEHDLAAAEFAAAAQETSDSEALRVLNLLEQHHKKLGQLLRAAHENPPAKEAANHASTGEGENALPMPVPVQQKQEPNRSPSPEATIHPPRLPRGLRSSSRELSSSIASNLASARGIPNNRQKRPTPISPLVSNQHADGHNAQDDTRGKSALRTNADPSDALLSMSRQSNSRPSWAPPISPPPAKSNTMEQLEAQSSDAPFQQFYTTFESLVSKLSAPLAFAGLPLTSAAPSKPPSTPAQLPSKAPKAVSRPAPAAPSVDYSQLISRAALRAVSGTGHSTSNPSESFYVVPTTGGTISYAEIMSRAEREEARAGLRGPGHRRQTSNLSNISEDNFVDAQSTILPAPANGPPGRFARARGGADEIKVNGKTMEELALENQALKHLSDTLSKRLHVFEMSAQTSSAALAQSIRSLHNRSPMLSPENSRGKGISGKMGLDSGGMAGIGNSGGGGNRDATQRRIAELEEILRKSDARARKREEENMKLKETITKYREKWDSLKAGAKARRARERAGRPGNGDKTGPGEETTTEGGEDESAAGG
ncbi:uncharacterized protein Z519_00105 [Cladophialophora bantiana CBS 173.52]|uniref:Uncharacterized protein n=1 Tax=Cladophialophora bantiana (strain ATCC 10958 / CBS 173.52 / CDC B-1940 / NIH 8579) TaxID=1442370 RepID=A0A0D2INW4_CLAB1|nr:uncharacterized protein Z519_00105 [Cladophialophora bantiana CBS 173.52]KIW98444.1 hypothetical protein Z519_00105 [Cladophialophora bantiana CBS 173.52]